MSCGSYQTEMDPKVKEVGVLVTDCPCLAEDMEKIWSVYWALGGATSLPSTWPTELSTLYNANNPLSLSSLSLEQKCMDVIAAL